MKKYLFLLFLLISSISIAGDTTTNGHFYMPSFGASGQAERTAWFNSLQATDAVIKLNSNVRTGADCNSGDYVYGINDAGTLLCSTVEVSEDEDDGITELSEDLTPQAGGDLDMQSYDINNYGAITGEDGQGYFEADLGILFNSNGDQTNDLTISTSGLVGVGTTDPQSDLDVDGTMRATQVKVGNDGSNGYLGIGTTNPTHNLEIYNNTYDKTLEVDVNQTTVSVDPNGLPIAINGDVTASSVTATNFYGNGANLSGISGGSGINWAALTQITSIADSNQVLINQAGVNKAINWDDFLTTLPSTSANINWDTFDNIEDINQNWEFLVNAAGTNKAINWDEFTDLVPYTDAGNITYVGCSDSISTAVTNATAGDTLVLGSCTYTLASAVTINKALTLKGQGKTSTIITVASNSIQGFNISSDGVAFEDMKITAVNGVTSIVDFNGESGAAFTNQRIHNVTFDIADTTSIIAIEAVDSSLTITDSEIYLTANELGSPTTGRGIVYQGLSTQDAPTVLNIHNVDFRIVSDDSSGSSTDNVACFRAIDTSSTQTMTVYAKGVTCDIRELSTNTNIIIGAYLDGNSVTGYLSNVSLNANPQITGSTNKRLDLYCDNGAVCNLDGNVTLVGGLYLEEDSATVVSRGLFKGTGLHLNQGNTPFATTSSAGTDAIDLFNGTGSTGGGTSMTGSIAAGEGADDIITLGAGGVATASTLTGTAGSGGDFVKTAGDGGDQTAVSGTANVGGAGGYQELLSGNGGDASGASTTNTSGNGGNFNISPGDNGTASGTGATQGIDGNLILGERVDGSEFGMVGIREDVRLGSSVFQVEGPDSSSNGDDFIAVFSEGDVTPESSFYNNITSQSKITIQAQQAPGILLKDTDDDYEAELKMGSTGHLILGPGTAGAIELQTSDSTKVTVTNDGYLGVGTTTPAAKFVVAPPNSEAISAAGTITANACGTIKRITSTGSVTTGTTDTFTNATSAGCCMFVVNTDSADTITLDNNANTYTNGAANVALGPNDTATFCSDGTVWRQQGATGNN